MVLPVKKLAVSAGDAETQVLALGRKDPWRRTQRRLSILACENSRDRGASGHSPTGPVSSGYWDQRLSRKQTIAVNSAYLFGVFHLLRISVLI